MKKISRFTLIETLIAAVLSGILLTTLITQLMHLVRARKTILQENELVLSSAEIRTRLQNVMQTNACSIGENTLRVDAGTLELKDGALWKDDSPLVQHVSTFHVRAVEIEDGKLVHHGVWTEKALPLFVQCVVNDATYTFPLRLQNEVCIECK